MDMFDDGYGPVCGGDVGGESAWGGRLPVTSKDIVGIGFGIYCKLILLIKVYRSFAVIFGISGKEQICVIRVEFIWVWDVAGILYTALIYWFMPEGSVITR